MDAIIATGPWLWKAPDATYQRHAICGRDFGLRSGQRSEAGAAAARLPLALNDQSPFLSPLFLSPSSPGPPLAFIEGYYGAVMVLVFWYYPLVR